jgi:hypothetical protein
MKIALVTGASGCGKTYVADALRANFESVSYDRLMRDSIERAFPAHLGDPWDKQIWLDNQHRLDLPAAFDGAFIWSGERPLIVEGWQLRETVWRDAVLTLATRRAKRPVQAALFLIRPTLELLLRQRADSNKDYHRRSATLSDCRNQLAIHGRMEVEQPWHGEQIATATKEEAVEAVRQFLSVT